jgi:hypothetical protein
VCGRFAIICGVRARKVLPDNKDKERNKTMIAMTTKNGRYVRLTASYDIEAGTATYMVRGSGGVDMTFIDFGSAAREYRRLSDELEYEKEVA